MELSFLFLGMVSGMGKKSGNHYCIVTACWLDLAEPVMCKLFVSDGDMEYRLSQVAVGSKFSCCPRNLRSGDDVTFFV